MTPVSVNNLGSLLGHNHLELISKHPKALEQLHSNLMKVSEPMNSVDEKVEDDVRVHQLINRSSVGAVLTSLNKVIDTLQPGDNLTKLKYVQNYLKNLEANVDRIKIKNFN
jgi:hypothetical protein